MRSAVAACAQQHRDHRGDARIGDPRLRAVDHPLVPVTAGGRLHAEQVRPRARLGQRQRAERLAAGQLGEPLRLLRGRPPALDRRAAQTVVRGSRKGGRAAGTSQFFERHHQTEGVDLDAAVFLRHFQAQQADVRHLADRLPVKLTGLIDFGGVGLQFGFAKIAHGALPHALFTIQFKIHCLVVSLNVDSSLPL